MKTALERKFWQRMWGESPSSISGIEHRKPRPEASLSEVAQRGKHKGGPKIMPFGNSDSFGSGGCLCNTQNVSQKVKFLLLLPRVPSLQPASPPLPMGKQGLI